MLNQRRSQSKLNIDHDSEAIRLIHLNVSAQSEWSLEYKNRKNIPSQNRRNNDFDILAFYYHFGSLHWPSGPGRLAWWLERLESLSRWDLIPWSLKTLNFSLNLYFKINDLLDFWMEALEDSYHSPVLMPMLKRFPLFDPALHKDHNH